MRIAGPGVGDAARRLRDRVIQGGLAVRRHARERRLDRAGVGGERLQRLQVHVEAEDRRFVARARAEPQRARARGAPPGAPPRSGPTCACCRSRRTAARRAPARSSSAWNSTMSRRAPASSTMKSSFVRLARETAVLVAHDRRDRHDVDRRSEGGLRRSARRTVLRRRERRRAHQREQQGCGHGGVRLIVTPPHIPRVLPAS